MLFRQIVTACALAAVESFVASDEASAMLAINGARTEQLQQVKELQHGSQQSHGSQHDRAARKAEQEEKMAERKAKREQEQAERKAEREAEREAKKAEKKLARETKQAEQKLARENKVAERQKAKQAERIRRTLHRGISADGKGECKAVNCKSCCTEQMDTCDRCRAGYKLAADNKNCEFSGSCPGNFIERKDKDGIISCHQPTDAGQPADTSGGNSATGNPTCATIKQSLIEQAEHHGISPEGTGNTCKAKHCKSCCNSIEACDEGECKPGYKNTSSVCEWVGCDDWPDRKPVVDEHGINHCAAAGGSGGGGGAPVTCDALLLQRQKHKIVGKDGSQCADECGSCCKNDENGKTLTSWCTSCKPDYKHDHKSGTCVKCNWAKVGACYVCSKDLDTCDQCQHGHYLKDGTCHSCGDLGLAEANCKMCTHTHADKENYCTDCDGGLGFAKVHNGTHQVCKKECEDNQKLVDGKCVDKEPSPPSVC